MQTTYGSHPATYHTDHTDHTGHDLSICALIGLDYLGEIDDLSGTYTIEILGGKNHKPFFSAETFWRVSQEDYSSSLPGSPQIESKVEWARSTVYRDPQPRCFNHPPTKLFTL